MKKTILLFVLFLSMIALKAQSHTWTRFGIYGLEQFSEEFKKGIPRENRLTIPYEIERGQPYVIFIEINNLENSGNLKIISPKGSLVEQSIQKGKKGKLTYYWVPEESGSYKIIIDFGIKNISTILVK